MMPSCQQQHDKSYLTAGVMLTRWRSLWEQQTGIFYVTRVKHQQERWEDKYGTRLLLA